MKLVVADDHPLLLNGIVNHLEGKKYGEVFKAHNGQQAWELIQEHKTTLAILDIEMPKLTGLEIAKRCKEDKLETKIIILSQHQEPELVEQAKELGISGYILKEDALEEIDYCIQAVLEGHQYYSSFFDTPSYKKQQKESAKLTTLTRSEIKILKLIADGMSSKKIAETIFVSERTIEKHRSNMIMKMNLDGKTNSLSEWAIANKQRISNL